MPWFDDTPARGSRVEFINPLPGRRRFTHAIHDIDGTHSLIRDWPPVMSLSMHWAMTCGLGEDFDSADNLARLIPQVGARPLPETDRYCVECAGFSALTQMEYAVRRAIETGNIPAPVKARLALTPQDLSVNSEIIRRIWGGEEDFPDIAEPPALTAYLREIGARLFRLYERILNGACRDRNTADARLHPERWRVPGSLEFLRHLHRIGCVNYFVTGAVVYADGGMHEEVEACGYPVGPGLTVESLRGSSWDRKMPKDEWIRQIVADEGIDPAAVLLVGDGRTEIKVGVEMGAITFSRLPRHELRQREIQVGLGVNYIVEDYGDPALLRMFGGDGGTATTPHAGA